MKGTYYKNRQINSKAEIKRKVIAEAENNRNDVLIDFPVNKYFLKKNKLNIPIQMFKNKELENEISYDLQKENYFKVINY